MGQHGKGYLFRRGAVYYLRRNVGGERVTESLGVTSRSDAETARRRVMAQDRAAGASANRLTAGESWGVFDRSPRRRQCSPSTLAGYAQQWGRFIVTLPDGMDLASVTREQASDYLGALMSEVGPCTYNKHVALLRYVWKVIALERGVTLPDVWAGVQGLTVQLVRHKAFSTDQISSMVAAAPEGSELRDMIVVAAHTGLRRADVVLMERSEVNLAAGMLALVPEKTRRTGAQATPGISASVRAVLERRMSLVAGNELFPESATVYRACPQTFGAMFQRFMVRTLNLNGDAGLYGFHSFRHWFSTTLTEAGVQERIIDAMMGHSRGKVANRYVHPSPAVLVEAVSKLPVVG